jgi:acetate kinase
MAVDGLGFLGIELEPDLNAAASSDAIDLSASSSRCRILVIGAREDLEIAGQVRVLLGECE